MCPQSCPTIPQWVPTPLLHDHPPPKATSLPTPTLKTQHPPMLLKRCSLSLLLIVSRTAPGFAPPRQFSPFSSFLGCILPAPPRPAASQAQPWLAGWGLDRLPLRCHVGNGRGRKLQDLPFSGFLSVIIQVIIS